MRDITRGILVKLNEQGDKSFTIRSRILKEVVEFEAFDTCCYEKWRNEARGLVWKVREIVNRKDAITRINIERKEEKLKNIREKEAALVAEQKQKTERIKNVRDDIYSLLTDENPHKRGKDFEKMINKLFACYGILVSDAFVIKGDHNEGIVEQIDGAIKLGNCYYLVEMKWWQNAIGKSEINDHIVRMQERGGQVKGLYISFSDYTEPAITACRNALNYGIVVVLVKLDEIFRVLEAEADLINWLEAKEQQLVIHKKPYVKIY